MTFRLFNDLDKSTTISSALPPPPTTSSFLALNAFKIDNPNNPVVFNIEINGVAILLKFLESQPSSVRINT